MEKISVYDSGGKQFAYRTKLDNGYFALISFSDDENTGVYDVCFGVAKNKLALDAYVLGGECAKTLDDTSTGQCGVQGLAWARTRILDFIIDALPVGGGVSVYWANSKRRRAYTHALTKIGFRECSRDGHPVLFYRKIKSCED